MISINDFINERDKENNLNKFDAFNYNFYSKEEQKLYLNSLTIDMKFDIENWLDFSEYKMCVLREEYDTIILKNFGMFQNENIEFPVFRAFTTIDGGLKWYNALCQSKGERIFVLWLHYYNIEDLLIMMLNFWYAITNRNVFIDKFVKESNIQTVLYILPSALKMIIGKYLLDVKNCASGRLQFSSS